MNVTKEIHAVASFTGWLFLCFLVAFQISLLLTINHNLPGDREVGWHFWTYNAAGLVVLFWLRSQFAFILLHKKCSVLFPLHLAFFAILVLFYSALFLEVSDAFWRGYVGSGFYSSGGFFYFLGEGFVFWWGGAEIPGVIFFLLHCAAGIMYTLLLLFMVRRKTVPIDGLTPVSPNRFKWLFHGTFLGLLFVTGTIAISPLFSVSFFFTDPVGSIVFQILVLSVLFLFGAYPNSWFLLRTMPFGGRRLFLGLVTLVSMFAVYAGSVYWVLLFELGKHGIYSQFFLPPLHSLTTLFPLIGLSYMTVMYIPLLKRERPYGSGEKPALGRGFWILSGAVAVSTVVACVLFYGLVDTGAEPFGALKYLASICFVLIPILLLALLFMQKMLINSLFRKRYIQ